MASIEASIGLKLDTISEGISGLRDQLAIEAQRQLVHARARKLIRYQINGTGANPFSMGGDTGGLSGDLCGPAQGYTWDVRLLVIEGLTASSTTPDVVNIRRSNASGRILWQLNGNQFAQTFSRGEMVLRPGETLFFQSVGTFAATGPVIAHGAADEVPAAREFEFFE